MLAECLEHLQLKPQNTFVDATLGGAGHSFEAATQLAPGGVLIGIDQDEAAHAAAAKRLNEIPEEQRPHIELVGASHRFRSFIGDHITVYSEIRA